MESTEMKMKIASYWDKDAAGYDSQHSHGLMNHREEGCWLVHLQNIFGDEPKQILDVGTGTGFLAILLARLGHHVTGIDLSEGMMAHAREKAEKAKVEIDFLKGDAENPDFLDNSFDFVTNRHLLWTLPHPDQAIAGWKRVVRPGGKVVAIDGDWFSLPAGKAISRQIGILIASCLERKKIGAGAYDPDTISRLPMMKPENAGSAEKLFVQAGLSDIKKYGLPEIDQIERQSMAFHVRLMNPYSRIVVEGSKSDE